MPPGLRRTLDRAQHVHRVVAVLLTEVTRTTAEQIPGGIVRGRGETIGVGSGAQGALRAIRGDGTQVSVAVVGEALGPVGVLDEGGANEPMQGVIGVGGRW